VQPPENDHAPFDEICAQLDEWDTLPAVTITPVEDELEASDEKLTSELDGQILAGLVSP
jgi:hypothetical protein